MATNGFIFANPKPSPDNINTLNPQDVLADSNVTTVPVPEAIPAPWRTPPTLALDQILDPSDVATIQSAGSIVFHAVGDTGGVKEPSHQFAVADAMTADLAGKTLADTRPAFFFHLGDVVYYFGQDRYYYDQFYDPYRDYDGPIFAIPGNHDGVLYSGEPVAYSLQPFCDNFCTEAPAHPAVAAGIARTTMTQPGVYFTLDAPFVKIIGLYSNTSEGATEGVLSGGAAGTAQLTFLQQQLSAAASQRSQGDVRALIIAVHHPPFTGSAQHAPSPTMLTQIDAACAAAGILPDLVLSGHAHLYERYTRFMQGRQIPFVVAGCGGYFNLSTYKTGTDGKPIQPPITGTDGKGNPLTLEAVDNVHWGFLRLTVTASSLTSEFVILNPQSGSVSTQDRFSLDLSTHQLLGTVTPKSGAKPSPKPAKPPKPAPKGSKRTASSPKPVRPRSSSPKPIKRKRRRQNR